MLKSKIRIDSLIALVGKAKKIDTLEILNVICFRVDPNSEGTSKTT